jgi:hypothetical protein
MSHMSECDVLSHKDVINVSRAVNRQVHIETRVKAPRGQQWRRKPVTWTLID